MDEFNERTDRPTSSFALTTIACGVGLLVVIILLLWFFATFDYSVWVTMGVGALAGGVVAWIIGAFMRVLKERRRG